MARVSPRPNFRGGVFLVIKTMFLQSLTIKYMYMYAITSTIKILYYNKCKSPRDQCHIFTRVMDIVGLNSQTI